MEIPVRIMLSVTTNDPVRIMLSVTTNDPDKLQKTVEHFSRVITGLAMDGVKTWLNVEQDPDEENNDG